MPFIGRAWKANVNIWKRHLPLQSVFNRGECMMHVDKNVDDHVVDQNVDRSSKEIAYVPLSGRIRSKRSSCMQFFFLFWKKKKMSIRHVYQWSRQNEDFRYDLEFWMCFPEVQGFEVWTCFPKVHWNWILDVLSRGPRISSLDVLPRGPLKLNFGRAF